MSYPREEPGAGNPPARICEGEAEWPSYSTTTFGAYPTLGIAAAREKRSAAKALLADGKNPMRAMSNESIGDGETFMNVAKRWHENRMSALVPAHANRVWSRLERDVFPFLGEMTMGEITPQTY